MKISSAERKKLREAIDFNKTCSDEEVIYDVGDWHSTEGKLFQIVNSNGEIYNYDYKNDEIVFDATIEDDLNS